MDIIRVDQKTCNKCGICAAECPGFLIDFQPDNFPKPRAITETQCIRCGHCVAVCPNDSLIHREIPLKDCIQVEEHLRITPQQCEQLLKSRRSVRAFKKQNVPREVVSHLIEVARYAPTGHNDQELEWLVIDNREELDRIERAGLEWIRWIINNQPQMAAMFNMEEKLTLQKKHNNVFMRGAPVLVVTHVPKGKSMAVIDGATALGYLDLMAVSLGLGTCWAGFIYSMANTFPPVKEALALPEGNTVCGCLMLGYNKFTYRRIPTRKEPKITWR